MIKGLFITDLHFGNGNINPFSLLDHIEFQIIPRLKDVDILIFGGDFFHTLLDLNEKSAICARGICEQVMNNVASPVNFFVPQTIDDLRYINTTMQEVVLMHPVVNQLFMNHQLYGLSVRQNF